MPGRPTRALSVVVFGALLAIVARAEDTIEVPAPGALTVKEMPDGSRVMTGSPSVKLTAPGKLVVLADHIVVWLRKDDAQPNTPQFQLHEFYAEGHLRLENGKQVLEAERAYVNVESGTLLVQKASVRFATGKRGLPITLTMEEMRRVGQGDTIGKDVSVSTCDFAVPDYHLVAKEVVIHGDWSARDIDVYGVTLRINPGDFPIFYTPWLPVSFGPQIPLRKLRYERSTNFGSSVFSKFGIDFPKTRLDEDGNPVLDEDGEPDTSTWGTVGLDADVMQRRGFGGGPEWDYQWGRYLGFGDVYYIRDRGDVPPSEFNTRLFPIPQKDRGRGRIFHRHDLWNGLSLDAEMHYVSDRNFREEFFEKEFKEDKAPESYLLARFMHQNFGMTALYRPRINDFQDYVEYLPQVTQSLVTQPTWLGFYLSHHAQFANVRFRKDEDVPDVEQPRTVRWDIQETLTRPFSLGPVRFLPWAGARYTYYDYAPSTVWWLDRYAAAWGVRARIAAWKILPWTSDLLRVSGVRHTASLEARLFNQYTTARPKDIYNFDAVDQVDRFQEVALEFRNRLETKAPNGEIYDALNFGIALEFYPDADRDTGAKVPQSILYPAYWLTVAPDNSGVYRPRRVSNIAFDLRATVRDQLTFIGTLDWSPYTHNIEETHAELRILPASNLTFRLTQQFVRSLTSTVGAGFDWRLSEKWTLSGESDYDFLNGRAIKHEYGVRRNLHDFDLELRIRYDGGRHEVGVTAGLIPHGKKESRLQGP